MSADKGWSQALLIGGIVAAGGVLYYLYSSSSTPRHYGESDEDVYHNDGQNENGEPSRQKKNDTTASKPLRNPLPPLPERPPAGKKRTASSKPSSATSKDDSNDPKPSSQAQASKSAEGQSYAAALKTDHEPESSSDASKHDSTADEDNVLDWSETAEEVIILLAVPASAQKHEVDYKVKPTHLTVSVQGVRLIQATLLHPVQPEDSIWQFDFYQGSRVIMITLQKATNGSGPADWDKLFLT